MLKKRKKAAATTESQDATPSAEPDSISVQSSSTKAGQAIGVKPVDKDKGKIIQAKAPVAAA